MKALLFTLLTLTASVVSASAMTVATPSNGATVSSPFNVVASTDTCAGVPATAMGYSLDSGSAVIQPTSFSAMVSASAGAHVLHVKCWGKKVADQILIPIVVSAPAASSDIVVASPATGGDIHSPFTVAASASACGGTTATALGYSIDGSKFVMQPPTFSSSVTANTGRHVLRVKCTGQGTTDQVTLNIHVVPLPAAPAPRFSLASGKYTTSQVVAIGDAVAGAQIYYTLDGSAPTTASNVYTGPLAVTVSQMVQAIAVAPGYSQSGIGMAQYQIVKSTGPQIPSNATTQTQVHMMQGWRIKYDPATPGSAVGAMAVVSDPSMSGQAQQFQTNYSNGGGVLYSLTYGKDATAHNFVYDAQVYIEDGSQLSNLEMDNNQVIPNGDTVIYAFQCSGNAGVWEYTGNAGTPKHPVVTWYKSSAPCDPATWTPNAWHHVQISYSRDDAGNVTYHSAWLDGAESPINVTVNSAFSLKWGAGALVTNFQVDGPVRGSGSSTLYLDDLTIYRW